MTSYDVFFSYSRAVTRSVWRVEHVGGRFFRNSSRKKSNRRSFGGLRALRMTELGVGVAPCEDSDQRSGISFSVPKRRGVLSLGFLPRRARSPSTALRAGFRPRPGQAPGHPAGVAIPGLSQARAKQNFKTCDTSEAVGCRLTPNWEAKMEIPVEIGRISHVI